MRAVILTNRQANQIALVNKIAPHIDVAAVIFSKNIPRQKPSLGSKVLAIINGIAVRSVGSEFRETWNEMLSRYRNIFPAIPIDLQVDVDNINDPKTFSVIEKHSPDLVLVSGTNIVGPKLIDAVHRSGKIMNLHTGISPYVKGGPNCTNWCLAKGWFHLIGNTVMWIDKGIDTGNIIATERTPLDGDESLLQLHWKVMEHAHDLYVRAVRRFAQGETLRNILQNDIGEGRLFLSRQWTAAEMRTARNNFKRDYPAYFATGLPNAVADVKLFPLT